MKKVCSMKLFYSVGTLGLCTFLVGCNAGPPIQGCREPLPVFNPQSGLCEAIGGGTGGTPGTGGGGGTGEGACTNMEDTATYEALTYGTEMGPDAASAIAGDCVFGAFDEPDIDEAGCAGEAGQVLTCVTNCEEPIANLTTCVVNCQQGIIEDKTGAPLTEPCAACYGASVACSSANCAAFCGSNPDAPACNDCRCRSNCTPGFVECSGLPSDACG